MDASFASKYEGEEMGPGEGLMEFGISSHLELVLKVPMKAHEPHSFKVNQFFLCAYHEARKPS